ATRLARKRIEVSNSYPQESQDQRCRTQCSLTCSDHAGATSTSPHCAQGNRSKAPAWFAWASPYILFLLRRCSNRGLAPRMHPGGNLLAVDQLEALPLSEASGAFHP